MFKHPATSIFFCLWIFHANILQGREHHPAECEPAWRLLCALGVKTHNSLPIFCHVFLWCSATFCIFVPNLAFCATSCIFAPNLAFLCHILHFCATFCIFAPHPAFLRHICYHAVTDWLSHNQSKLPISSHSANDVANLKQQWLHLSQLSNKSFAPLTLETLIINQLYQATQIWPISSYHFDSTYHQFWKLHVIALFVSAECVTFITYDSTNLNLLEF